MKEELPRNDDVLHNRQMHTLTNTAGRPVNGRRCYVSTLPIAFFLLLAVAGLCLWLLRLLGIIPLPF